MNIRFFLSRRRCASIVAASALLSSVAVTSGTATAQDSPLYQGAESALRGSAALGSGQLVPGSVDVQKDDFYSTLPVRPEGAPGDILKTAPSNFALGIPFVDWTGSHATRVAYVSTDSEGKPITVTGTVLTPSAPWRGKGPRPLLTVAPGTQGSGDACAPGKLLPFGLEYEAVPVAAALARGWNVALTDMHGLGTTPQHTYMNRVYQAHATLDMARAAVNMKLRGLGADSPIATWGYSQGGGSSAAALEMQPSYASDINLVAGFAGAVPADLDATARYIDNGALAGVIGYTINGFMYSNPEIRPLIDELLNDEGKKLLAQTADECIPQTIAKHMYTDSRALTKTGESLSAILEKEPLRSLIKQQEIGHLVPKVPVYVGHGINDDTIPVGQARRMAQLWCQAGAQVYYQEQNIPHVAPLVDHMNPMMTNLMPALDWLEKVVNGQKYPTSNCSDIPPTVPVPATSMGSARTALDTSVAGVPGSLGSAIGSASPQEAGAVR